MTWWMWMLVAWAALVPPAAVLIGRMIHTGQARDAERQRDQRRTFPPPRDGDERRSA